MSTIGRMPITRRSPKKTLPRPDGKVVRAWSVFGQFFVRKVLAWDYGVTLLYDTMRRVGQSAPPGSQSVTRQSEGELSRLVRGAL